MLSVVIATHESERLWRTRWRRWCRARSTACARGDRRRRRLEGRHREGRRRRRLPLPGAPGRARCAARGRRRHGARRLAVVPAARLYPGTSWIEELRPLHAASASSPIAKRRAAVFRARGGRGRSPLSEALALIAARSVRGRTAQGLLIAKPLYRRLAATAAAADPERTCCAGSGGTAHPAARVGHDDRLSRYLTSSTN